MVGSVGVRRNRNSARPKDWVNMEAVQRMSFWTLGDPKSTILGIRINPVATIAATVVLWAFILACLFGPKDDQENFVFLSSLNNAKSGITRIFTWLYIGNQQCLLIFIICLYFSKYGNMKLGKDDDKPEYSTSSWFMMLFAAGVGVGLLYFGVAEPIAHYKNDADHTNDNRNSHVIANERAQHAINLTWYHWGIHAWVVYAVVGLTMALVGYRKGLPVTMRSCFYPVLGDKAFGPIGDMIDVLSAVCTMFGVCCSLGLGVMDVSAGIVRVGGCPGTLSQDTCESYPQCMWTSYNVCKPVCAVLDKAANSAIFAGQLNQCIGADGCRVELQGTTSSITSWDATSVEAIKDWRQGLTCAATDTMSSFNADNVWHLVGLIWVITAIASISVVTGVKLGIQALSVVCFSVGMFLWVYVFFTGEPWYFLDIFVQQIGLYFQTLMQVGSATDAYSRHSPLGGASDSGASAKWMDTWTMFYWGWWISWSPFVGMFIAKISRGRTIRQFINGTLTAPAVYGFAWFTVFGGDGLRMERAAEMFGLSGFDSPAYLNLDAFNKNKDLAGAACMQGEDGCAYYSRLSQRPKADMWMDMISRHFNLGPIMMIVTLIALVLYFITSADSGSLVVDSLCSNGREDSPALQKIYWAFTQGAAATALLVVGWSKSSDASNVLNALQAASISSGLSYTILIIFMCASLWKTCKYESGDEKWCHSRFFRSDLFNVFDVRFSQEWAHAVLRTMLATVAPWYFLHTSLVHGKFKSKQTMAGFRIMMAILFYLVPLFCILEAAFSGAAFIGIWWYLCFVTLLSFFRGHMRSLKNINGDFFEDAFASLFMYPMVVEQLDAHFRIEGAGKLDLDDYVGSDAVFSKDPEFADSDSELSPTEDEM